MKIVPIKIDTKTLYENRHLYTDDTQYNSLIFSNLLNKNINLLDMQSFDTLDKEYRKQIYENNPPGVFHTEIFTKGGFCSIYYNNKLRITFRDTIIKKWETMVYIIPDYNILRLVDILAIVD